MGRFTRTLGPIGTIAGAVALWLAVFVTVGATGAAPRQNGSKEAKPAAAPAAQAANASGYVGDDDICLTCHEDTAKGYRGSPHGRAKDARTPAAKAGCESCHGPGQAHVDADGDKTKIKQPAKISTREASDICLTCHNRSEHDEWSGGKHDSRNVGCLSCHSVHTPKSEKRSSRPRQKSRRACSAIASR